MKNTENYKLDLVGFFLSIISVFILCFFIMIVSIKDNPLYNKISFNLFYFVPQGWSFFTKETAKYEYSLYKISGNKIINIDMKNSSPAYFYGLSKENRILPGIIDNSLGNINENLWYQTRKDIKELETLDSINIVRISYNFEAIKGVYLIKLQEVQPWFYFSNNINYKSENYYLKVNIR